MKKTRYDIETLTEALNVLNQYEQNIVDGTFTSLIMSDIATLMKRLEAYMDGMSPSVKQNKIDVFQVITEISFDKLEKDVMGVN